MKTNNLKEQKEQTEQELNRINKLASGKKATYEKISRLLNAQQKWKTRELGFTNVKEPIMLFGRRNNQFEIYEGVTTGMLEFKHTSGQKRFIIVDPNTQCVFGAGKTSIKGYWAHEDHPISGWPNPLATTEQVNIIIEKTLNDQAKWKAKDKEALGNMWLKIGLGIGAIVLAVAMYKLLVPQPQAVQVIYETAKENITQAAQAAQTGILNLTKV